MKYFFIISMFFISSLLPMKAHAGAAGGGATELTQMLNNGQLLGVNISDAITAFATKGTFVKTVILDPIANALISSALQGASNDILSWVSGGFGGADPLIIADPEGYLKKQGLLSVKGMLDGIPSDTAYGDSIFNTLLSQYKGAGDLKSKIKEISKSNVPSLIQNNLCNDAKITSLSLEAVQNDDGTYDQQELTAKKTELWNYACVGSADDPVTAARLQDLSSQNFSVGGWDEWLAITSGDNEYERSRKVAGLVQEDLEKQEELNIEDLYNGLGPISEKECVEPTEPEGPGEQPGCNEWVTITPGDQVGDTLSEALNAGVKRLENIMGDGSLTGMLQGFAISAITSGIKKALNSSSGGSKYNLTVTLPSSRPIVQDLVNDPLKKTENLTPMNKQFGYYLTTLNNLYGIDSRYMSDLVTYEARVATIKECSIGAGVYANRMSLITPVKTMLTAELASTTAAITYTNETKAKVAASNSTQEQRTIFTAYLSAIEDRGYPTSQTEGIRQGEYTTNKFNVDHDTELTNTINACAVVTPTTVPGSTAEPRGS